MDAMGSPTAYSHQVQLGLLGLHAGLVVAIFMESAPETYRLKVNSSRPSLAFYEAFQPSKN